MVLLASLLGLLAAWYAAAALDAGAAVGERLVRRFDLTALALAALIALLRIPTRVEHDHRDGWLAMFLAAGASRTSYLAGIITGAYVASAAFFCVTAVAFSTGAYVIGGSVELLAALHVTLAGGLLLLASWCVWSGLAAVLFRRALPAFFAAAAVALFPHLLIISHALRMEVPDTWIVWLLRSVPPLLPPGLTPVIIWQLAAMVIAAAAAACAARRFIGRHA
jgi:hypothetical protein